MSETPPLGTAAAMPRPSWVRVAPLLDAPRVTALLLLALAVLYVVAYGLDPSVPGHDRVHPTGWWGWFDQGRYLASARAFASGDLSTSAHWYPMGYPLLGALFVGLMPDHPFFVIDLVCFLAAAALFAAIAARFAVPRNAGLLLFALATLSDGRVFREWIIPWNTSPVVVWVYAALFVAVRRPPPGRLAVAVAALCAAVTPLTRPADAAMMLPLVVAIAGRCLVEEPLPEALRRLALGLLVGAVPLALYGALHVRIYGWAPTEYMGVSRHWGFELELFWQRLYGLVIDPLPLWGEGDGMARSAPWLLLAVPGGVLGLRRWGLPFAAVAVVVVANVTLYTAYRDMAPTNLWRFNLVHYYKVSYPLAALIAWIALERATRSRANAAFLAVSVALVLSIRLETTVTPASAVRLDGRRLVVDCVECGAYRALRLAPVVAPADRVHFGWFRLATEAGPLTDLFDYRLTLVGDRLTVVFPRLVRHRRLEVEPTRMDDPVEPTRKDDPVEPTRSNAPPVAESLRAEAVDVAFALALPRLPGR